MKVYEKLLNIQAALKAPKSQYNNFGKYSYRSCEDILEAVKPLLLQNKAILNITDEVVQVGERFYVKAVAKLTDVEDGSSTEVTAYAREDETKKGMDLAQVTGSVSSYARKYALNGLFCIDDTKDSDSTNTHGKDKPTEGKNNNTGNDEKINEAQAKRMFALAKGNTELVKDVLMKHKYFKSADVKKAEYEAICAEIQGAVK